MLTIKQSGVGFFLGLVYIFCFPSYDLTQGFTKLPSSWESTQSQNKQFWLSKQDEFEYIPKASVVRYIRSASCFYQKQRKEMCL